MKSAIGIDVGGTDIKSGLLLFDGTVVARESAPTEADGGVDHVIARIVRQIIALRDRAKGESREVAGVGLGMPGILSQRRGVVIAPPNLPGWKDVPIVSRVESAIGLRVNLENDANNAALGEWWCGAGRGVRDLVMLTLGTGVGSGIIVDGRLVRGAFEQGGELGHMIVQPGGRRCACGQLGCLEAYVSASHTAARAREAAASIGDSILADRLELDEEIDAKAVEEAVREGDEVAEWVWNETCKYLAIACINIQHALDPQRIILAGGMSGAGDLLRDPVERLYCEMASPMLGGPPEICIAELGNDAGFVGAGMSVFHDPAGEPADNQLPFGRS